MASLTVQFSGQKTTFKFGNTNGLEENSRTNELIKKYFSGKGNGTITAKNQNEYNEIVNFLKKADTNKDGIIDGKDYSKLRNDELKYNKFNPACFGEGGEDFDAISGKRSNGNYLSIVF